MEAVIIVLAIGIIVGYTLGELAERFRNGQRK